jgi:hypothetical protein
MRNRFDHLAKQLGEKALGQSGPTVVNEQANPETQYADLLHQPDPSRDAARARLGLLGRFAAVPCLIEVYSRAPGAEEFRACLAKHLAFWQQRTRKARTVRRRRAALRLATAEPFLWILAAGTPASILTELTAIASSDWPAGVYFVGAGVLRVAIVAVSELPRDRSTLLVRLMAAGPTLPRAIEDLIALPANADERVVAEQILLQWQRALTRRSQRTAEEEEFVMAMHKGWEELRTESIAAGVVAAQADAVLTVLRARGIAVSDAVQARISSEKNLRRLKRWLEKAAAATSIADVIGAPARRR